MTSIPNATTPKIAGTTANEDARLLEQAKKLEGVFIAQLYQAMRATVPEGGMSDGSAGEDLFTSMLDDAVADLNVGQRESELSRALYDQLRRRTSVPQTGQG